MVNLERWKCNLFSFRKKKTKEYFERVTETSRIKRTYAGGLCCLPEKPGYWDQRAKS